jgi:hypothetical protein
VYRTGKKQEADIAQFCLESLGGHTSLSTIYRKEKNTEYVIRLNINGKYKSLESSKPKCDVYTKTPLDGKVYCFTTETGYWVARRNNKVFITGNCGKDVAAEWILHKYNAQHLRFKDQLYKVAAQIAGIEVGRMIHLATDREIKEKPTRFFVVNGSTVSPRQWLIHCSETIVKPLLGSDFFGKSLANSITEDLVVCSDGGFESEVLPLITAGHDVYVLRIERDGYTFDGDSRSYLPVKPFYKTILVENNKSLLHFENKIYGIVDDILGISGTDGKSA